MGIFATLIYAVGLSMDACAVAMTNGMSDTEMPVKRTLLIGLFFGFFQFLMPVIGYFVTGIIANAFVDAFKKASSWVSFGLLAFLGGKMLYDGLKEWIESKNPPTDGCENCETVGAGTRLTDEKAEETLSIGKLFLQAIATSIDALAVGVTLQTLEIKVGLALGVWGTTAVIGVMTFALSVGAVYIGKLVGTKLTDKAEILGGVVLLAIGLKILLG
ncbi:MAG: manganese efflux pump [Clostridia bacterium]|nr:manganese efflux pump [Clostridia bacterium]